MRLYIRLALSSALALGWANPAWSQHYLSPAEPVGALVGYEDILRRAFAEVHDAETRLSATVIPNSMSETAIGLRQSKNRYRVVVLKPAVHLWRFELVKMMEADTIRGVDERSQEAVRSDLSKIRKSLPARPEDVRLARCERVVPPGLAKSLVAVWEMMLTETRNERPQEIVLHGTSYNFEARIASGVKRGTVYAPRGTSRTGAMAELADRLQAYCRNRASEKELGKLARRVLTEEPEAPVDEDEG